MTKISPNAEPEPEQSETVENMVAIGVIVFIIFIFIGFSQSWWGLFENKTTEPVVLTSTKGDPFKGDENAPITIVEYSDFECPFCGRWYREVYPLLKETYIDTGRAKLIFKQFPLTRMHPNAMNAAIASECAYQQDKFWEYHDLLFEHQTALDVSSLKSYAKQLGLNTDQFDKCLDNQNTRPEVDDDYSTGVNSGVTGTPAFVIGEEQGSLAKGEIIVGAQPLSAFEEIIERLE